MALGRPLTVATLNTLGLPPGRPAGTIDFILVTPPVTALDTGTLFTRPVPLPDGGTGLVSDHIGLTAALTFVQSPRPPTA